MELRNFLSSLRAMPALLITLAVAGCGDGGGSGYGGDYNGGLNGDGSSVPTGYKLLWSDEFNQNSSITANWNVETGYGPNNAGWGNDESQLYTGSTDNLKIVADPNDSANGMLSITARCATGVCGKRDGTITSARITTKDKTEFTYGNVQARIKVPNGKSTWPAFWMLGANYPDTAWPASGEIDIMEVHQANSNINTTQFAAHWDNNGLVSFVNKKSLAQPLSDDFHIYELEWTDKKLTGKIDGSVYFEKTIDPATMDEFQKPFFLLLNVAIDGTLGAEPDAIKTTPQEMLVDWVRVYQEDKATSFSIVRDDVGAAEDTLSHTTVISDGNTVTVDLSSSDVTPAQGSSVIKLNYAAGTESYAGAAFQYSSADISDYNVLKFSIDTNDFPNFDDLSIEFVDTRNPGGASTLGKQSVQLKSYASAASARAGNWRTVEIPLADFPNVSFDKIKLLGFWNPKNSAGQLIPGILYIDNLLLVRDASKGNAPVYISNIPPAPQPTAAASDVIALFSNAYSQITNVNYNPNWQGQTTLYSTESVASGDDVIKLANLNFIGTDFAANVQNLSAMTHLHLDFYTEEDIAANTALKIKLVDFGANGAFGGGDDSSHELSYSANTAPSLVKNNWVSFDIPLSYFTQMTSRQHVAQFVVSSENGLNTIYLDNIYFYNAGNSGAGMAPATAPATPSAAAADVIAIYSDAYMAITGVDFDPAWGDSTVYSQENIASNNVIKLATLNYQGIDFIGNKQDVSGHTALHFDYWTPDVSTFKFFLISKENGGTQEVSHNVSNTIPGQWQSISVPLSDFSGVDLTKLAQIKIDATADTNGGVLYLDNIYFSKTVVADPAPTDAPATPTATGTLSVFSDAYTPIAGVNVNPNWNQTTVTTIENIAGNNVLKMKGLDYQGIDWVTAGSAIDVSGMTTLHIDYWTADSTGFNVYAISTGPKEKKYEVTPTTNSWQSLDIPLSHFTSAGSTVNLADLIQLKFDGNGTLYLDNIYFYGGSSTPNPTPSPSPTPAATAVPTVAASAPTADATKVVSLFSNAYTNVPVGDWSTSWDKADVTDTQVSGNDVKLYTLTDTSTGRGFIGINFDNANSLDGTTFTALRFDVWTPDVTELQIKLVDFGGDGYSGGPGPTSNDSEGIKTVSVTKENWQTIEIPISDFTGNGLNGVTDLSQIVIESTQAGAKLYLDNLYFTKP